MSTCQETILPLARIISGAGQEEEALLEPLCQAAEAQWRGRLRQGVAAEDCGETFACAAAFTAAANGYLRSITFQKDAVIYNRLLFLLLDVGGVQDMKSMTVNGGTENIPIGETQIPVLAGVVIS